MRYSLNILWLVVGVAIGVRFADIDQHVPFLVHRSILTHGFLVPLLLLYLIRKPRPLMDDGSRSLSETGIAIFPHRFKRLPTTGISALFERRSKRETTSKREA